MGDRRLRVVALLAVGVPLGACAPATPPPSPNEIAAKYRAKLDANMEKIDRHLVWPTCDDMKKPPATRACGLIITKMTTDEMLARFVSETCEEEPGEKVSDRCVGLFNEWFADMLSKRYTAAMAGDVQTRCARPPGCASKALLEYATMDAHNAAVFARGRDEARAIVDAHERAQQDAAVVRMRQRDDEEARRRANGAIAAGLAAFGQGMQAQQQRPRTVVITPSCSNDIECGIGNLCVKPVGSFEGQCARAVDAYGTPTMVSPRTDSFGPGKRQCWTMSECPIGFNCEQGVCVK